MRTILAVFVGMLIPCILNTSAMAAGTCKVPRMMIILDKSSSMVTGTVGSQTKWDVAKSALSQVATTYESSIDLGLMVFPTPNQCGGGKVVVGIGPNNAQPITAQLATAPPSSGNWTPMAQSLGIAATVTNLQDSAYSNNVLLITDGWQWCSPYDAKTRFLPVNEVQNLKALGIKTYVVGFGDSVDTLTLNKMAAAAGTKISKSCDATNTDPKAKDNCYYQANNPQELLTALQNIAKQVTAETCDGQDNDCDGQIDENVTRSCTSACGTGSETCSNGVWGVCSAPQPTTEICGDAVDNDCDGSIDEGCGGCVDGQTKTCGVNTGECMEGIQTCVAGNWSACSGGVSPVTEVCDGKDNDCDGQIDEGCGGCVDGQTKTCGVNTGECMEGIQTCVAGNWGACSGGVSPVAEVCDGKDNDCDGQIDENLTRSCSTVCGAGTEACTNGTFQSCTAQQPAAETCDGIDNDCDGTVDGPDATCDNGQVCINGACQDPDLGKAGKEGCDCTLGVAPRDLGQLKLLGLGLLGLLLLVRRRRR